MLGIDPTALRLYVYDEILARGTPPRSEDIGARFGVSPNDARHALAGLKIGKTILVHPAQLSPAVPYDACWRYAIDGLRALKGKAEASHLRLGLENVWNKFLMSPLEANRLVHEVDSPQVGIWFDVGNVTVFGFAEQWLRILGGKRIVGIHIKDFRRGAGDAFGTYEGFVPLFHGSVNWPVVMREIAALGVGDWLVTEVSPGGQPFVQALGEIARQLDVLISLARDGEPHKKE